MSAWRYLTRSDVISGRPCQLLSVVVTTAGTGPGQVVLYDERSAAAGQEVATLLCEGDHSAQFLFYGLEMTRGLYVQLVANADYVTVEWEPPPQPPPAACLAG